MTMSEDITRKVVIEVGGEHGDGNVEVVECPDDVTVVIRDWDNATLDENDNVVPEERII